MGLQEEKNKRIMIEERLVYEFFAMRFCIGVRSPSYIWFCSFELLILKGYASDVLISVQSIS